MRTIGAWQAALLDICLRVEQEGSVETAWECVASDTGCLSCMTHRAR